MTIENIAKYESRFITSADETEIFTDAIGNRYPGTPVIVFIHGGLIAKGSFIPIFEDLKWISRAFLVQYDTRGHGRSGKPLTDEGWESKMIWEDFEAVCREFEVTTTYVFGRSLGSGHFVDVMTYNTSVTISGFINVAGAISLDSATFGTHTSEVYDVFETVARPPSVDAFQEAAFNFISSCSDKFSPDLARVLLEEMMLQPRRSSVSVNTWKHNTEKLYQEAQDGQLPLLAIGGGRDKILDAEQFRLVLEGIGQKSIPAH